MATTIFLTRTSSTEEWLDVSEDGTVTYHKENDGWKMARKGLEEERRVMTCEHAKAKWPWLAKKIDEALASTNHTK